MPVVNQLDGYDVIYTFSGAVNVGDVHEYFRLRYADYAQIGDALGIIIDLTPITKTNINLYVFRAFQAGLQKTNSNLPVALVGKANGLVFSLLRTMRIFSRRHTPGRYSLHDDISSAKLWTDYWFQQHGFDRQALYGQISFTENNFED